MANTRRLHLSKSFPLSRISLPGFDAPIDVLSDLLFRSALCWGDLYDGHAQQPLTTLREFTMLRIMNTITDKPDWDTKVFNEEITSKWRAEALTMWGDEDITDQMIDWCIAELRYKTKIFKETGAISVFTGDVVKSDIAIPESLREELRNAVKPLEDVPDKMKDWHPDSGDKVLDLVHPSLFPLVYGRTRFLGDGYTSLEDCIQRCGEGEVLPVPQLIARKWGREPPPEYSLKFQWLPCDVDISGEQGARILSYINNLHPQTHQSLYTIIERIIDHVIPLWNMVLTSLKFGSDLAPRIVYTECEYDPDPEEGSDSEGPQRGEDEDYSDFWHRRNEWYEATRRVVMPEPGEFSEPKTRDPGSVVDLKKDYSQHGLQIIVKLANIHLTPDKPQYDGGTWHVEGQLNEHICASAIYYYDTENITPSSLDFRQQSTVETADEVNYRQSHDDWLQVVFGCSNWSAAVQHIGAVQTPQSRLLAWPNVLQHRVQPFELADRTKPGHRKILALFLVDPNIRIISTANVPCQQRDWWAAAVVGTNEKGGGGGVSGEGGGGGRISALPVELQDTIFRGVDEFPIGMEEAKELRVELMKERKNFVVKHGRVFEESHQFSLCEH